MISIGKDGPKNENPKEEVLPEPEKWDDFYPKAKKKLHDWLKNFEQKKISKLLLPQKKLSDAHRDLHRAVETKKFLEGEFWNNFLNPMLGDEQELKPWTPGDVRSLEQVAVDHLFASGKAAFAKIILSRFEEWIRIGEEAKKIIAQDVERRREVREFSRE